MSFRSIATKTQHNAKPDGPLEPGGPLDELTRTFVPPKEFAEYIQDAGINYFAGVPDSLLKDFCAYLTENVPAENHVITANEGAAIGLAAGYHLATKGFAMAYLQNSGLGNTINPLLSLTDSRVYSIPMLLLIGWRGEPGKKDEPQHIVQGAVMNSILASCSIPFEILPDYLDGAKAAVDTAVHYMSTRQAPYALIVKRQTFDKYKLKLSPPLHILSREEAIAEAMDWVPSSGIVVATTGMASRELYEIRKLNGERAGRDFLTVGSMGHASAIALGIALQKPNRSVYCLDGDGSVLMHMGTMGTIVETNALNFKHIIMNNGAHDSVGGQPSAGRMINFANVGAELGYKWHRRVSTKEELQAGMQELSEVSGPALLEIMINCGGRANLGRPKESPKENKALFMEFLSE